MPRLFVAVPVREPSVVAALEAVETEARKERVRWTPGHQLHFTLRFFAAVEEARVAALKDAVSKAAERVARFGLELVGLGAFPRPAAPRVIWVGTAAGTEALTSLAARISTELSKAGFPAEERPFRPHLTLGRVREGHGSASLEELLYANAARAFGTTLIGEVVLYQSVLGSGPAAHTPLLTCRLV